RAPVRRSASRNGGSGTPGRCAEASAAGANWAIPSCPATTRSRRPSRSRSRGRRTRVSAEENGRSRPVSGVLSPRPVAGAEAAAVPVGHAWPRASSERTGEHGGQPLPLVAAHPYLLLLRVGLAVPPPSPAARCALAAPFLPCLPFGGRSVLCGAVPRVASAGR